MSYRFTRQAEQVPTAGHLAAEVILWGTTRCDLRAQLEREL